MALFRSYPDMYEKRTDLPTAHSSHTGTVLSVVTELSFMAVSCEERSLTEIINLARDRSTISHFIITSRDARVAGHITILKIII